MNNNLDLFTLSTNPEYFIDRMFETKDRTALKMYLNWSIMCEKKLFINYQRRFGLCQTIGAKHIFDIGCGLRHYQAYMLLLHHDLHYTGIDRELDPHEMMRVFSHGFHDRGRFISDTYPCTLTIPENNIAIAAYIGGCKSFDDPQIINFADALSQDFDRIITNYGVMQCSYDELYEFWAHALPGYSVCKLGEEDLIFATRIPHDLEVLHEINYKYTDEKFGITCLGLC